MLAIIVRTLCHAGFDGSRLPSGRNETASLYCGSTAAKFLLAMVLGSIAPTASAADLGAGKYVVTCAHSTSTSLLNKYFKNSHAPFCFSGVDFTMPMLGPKRST